MKFLSIREFRASTGQLKDMLSGDGKIVLTSNGKPAALMIGETKTILRMYLMTSVRPKHAVRSELCVLRQRTLF